MAILKTINHEGVEIQFRDDGQFLIDGGPANGYSSLQQAYDAAHKQALETRREQLQRLDIPAIAHWRHRGDKRPTKTEKVRVTGIHGRLGSVLTKPKVDRDSSFTSPGLYIDCPQAVELLAQVDANDKQAQALADALEQYELRGHRGYGIINDETHAAIVKRIQQQVAKVKS